MQNTGTSYRWFSVGDTSQNADSDSYSGVQIRRRPIVLADALAGSHNDSRLVAPTARYFTPWKVPHAELNRMDALPP